MQSVASLHRAICHCEEGAQATDVAIHRVSRKGVWVMRFPYWFPVDRHGLRPRDDKTGKTECYEWTLKN